MQNPPEGIKLIKSENALEITWAQEPPVRLPARRLRCDCRCAACVDENTGRRILDVDSVPLDLSIRDLSMTGAYALKITFGDGHDNGLFTWEHLRELAHRAGSSTG